MKIYSKILSLILVFTLCFSFLGCKKGSGIDLFYFGTNIHVETYSTNISSSTEDKIKNLLLTLENEFDVNKNNSLTNDFNNANDKESFVLSNHAKDIFEKVNFAHSFSDGYFNPTVYPLVKLYGFAPYKYTLTYTPPTLNEINKNLSFVDFNAFTIENGNLVKNTNFVKLDLGGIVKGYSVDKIAKILIDDGHTDGYISVGGSSLNLLSVNDLLIRHPRKTVENGIVKVKLNNQKNLSVSTSGDYEKYYTDELGNKYCHIINPKTGLPTTTNVSSVTLLGIDSAISDALTTAGCLMEFDENNITNNQLYNYLKKIQIEYPDCYIFAIYSGGRKIILTNKNQGENFTLIDTEYTVYKI